MATRLAALFCDHMVLQRNIANPVWGWDAPGTKVTVTVGGNIATGLAGPDGKWLARVPALTAGGPHELVVRGSDTVTVRDVLVGEVWVCSGQSNMEWLLAQAKDAVDEVAAANYPAIRTFTVPKIAPAEPQADVVGTWVACTPATAGSFSAVGYFFGRKLYQELNVPIGLINTSWGGTRVEPWTSREEFMADAEIRPFFEQYEKGLATFDADFAKWQAEYKVWTEKYTPKDTGNAGLAKGWAAAATPDADWPEMCCPCNWQSAGLQFNGIVWFRKSVDVPADWAGKDLTLSLGPCDDYDITYFNGVQVGAIGQGTPNWWSTPRVYTVPGKLVHAGKNLVAVRICDTGGSGGFMGSAGQMSLGLVGAESGNIPLAGAWRYQVEVNFGIVSPPPGPRQPFGPGNPNAPTTLYNGMIYPLVPYGIAGAIWYQGESNADEGYDYRLLFPAMIRDWRRAWAQGDFPFFFVQLANFTAALPDPAESTWAELREAQTLTMTTYSPNTGMAVIIDIGEGANIHPTNKQDVGLRLALPALAKIYGHNIVHYGPIYRFMAVEGSKIRLSFDHVGGGLVARGGKLIGFAIAGSDRKFVWADAVIDGKTVVVWSPKVVKPVAVRYAWANNPICNFYNAEDLPATPFRTDDWRAG